MTKNIVISIYIPEVIFLVYTKRFLSLIAKFRNSFLFVYYVKTVFLGKHSKKAISYRIAMQTKFLFVLFIAVACIFVKSRKGSTRRPVVGSSFTSLLRASSAGIALRSRQWFLSKLPGGKRDANITNVWTRFIEHSSRLFTYAFFVPSRVHVHLCNVITGTSRVSLFLLSCQYAR